MYATSFWQSDNLLYRDLKLYGFGKAEWKNIEFVQDDNFDVVIIFTAPHKNHKSFGNREIITFLSEPPESPHRQKISNNISPMYISFPWWIYSTKKEDIISRTLKQQKEKLLSAVTSELCWLRGHQKRLQFLFQLDGLIAEGLDIFGRKQTGQIFSQFNNYCSELADKYDGLLPYEYHFACENSFIPDYFTEKILDPIVAECLCFYDGCSNMEKYLDYRAFIRIDVTNIHQSIDTILRSIEDDEFSKRRKFITKEKQRILTHLNPLNIIWAALNEKDLPEYFKL